MVIMEFGELRSECQILKWKIKLIDDFKNQLCIGLHGVFIPHSISKLIQE